LRRRVIFAIGAWLKEVEIPSSAVRTFADLDAYFAGYETWVEGLVTQLSLITRKGRVME
jgi:hypothetical protein